MGDLSPTAGKILFGWEGARTYFLLDGAGQPDATWQGEVFFDHLHGVLDPNPKPVLASAPFRLVCFWQDNDYTMQHVTKFTPWDDAAALIARAAGLVAEEKARGNSNYELWEVYGVRLTRR